MERREIQVQSREETAELARRLAAAVRPGDVVGLCGDLGAGKTYFASEVARALDVPESDVVSSPTFTIIHEYRGGRLPIYHLDLYRLRDSEELYELGVWEHYDGDGVCLVEWCDRFDELWPAEALVITLALGAGETRGVVLEGDGRGAELAAAIAGRGAR